MSEAPPRHIPTLALEVVAATLESLPVEMHGEFLDQLMVFTAAGLVRSHGRTKASEVAYRVADAIVGGRP